MISGFPNESEEDHQDTLSLMDYVKYDFGFMFMYSERPGTPAAKKLEDNIPESVKKRRLQEVVAKQQQHGLYQLLLTPAGVDKGSYRLLNAETRRRAGFETRDCPPLLLGVHAQLHK